MKFFGTRNAQQSIIEFSILVIRKFRETGKADKILVHHNDSYGVLASVNQVGVEGTGSYGIGLTRHLLDQGVSVVEVVRPNRQTRRRRGKTDAIDAETAARSVLAGTALGTPKAADGAVEMIRTLRLVRRSAMKARTPAANQLRAVLVEAASKLALKSLATRYQQLTTEITTLDGEIERLAHQAAPQLMAIKGRRGRRRRRAAGRGRRQPRTQPVVVRSADDGDCTILAMPVKAGLQPGHQGES